MQFLSFSDFDLDTQAAVTFGLDNFKRTLLPFIEKNTAEIFNTKTFNELSDTTLSYILQSDELNMDEYDLLIAIRGWAVVNSVRFFYFYLPCVTQGFIVSYLCQVNKIMLVSFGSAKITLESHSCDPQNSILSPFTGMAHFNYILLYHHW